MTKEWIYFIAGAGLTGVVIFSVGCSEAPTNCKNVAHYATFDGSVQRDDLTDRELKIAVELYGELPYRSLDSVFKERGNYVDMYARCVAIEGAFE